MTAEGLTGLLRPSALPVLPASWSGLLRQRASATLQAWSAASAEPATPRRVTLDQLREAVSAEPDPRMPFWLTLLQGCGEHESLAAIVARFQEVLVHALPELPATQQALVSQASALALRDALALQERCQIGSQAERIAEQAAQGARDGSEPDDRIDDALAADIARLLQEWGSEAPASREAANASLIHAVVTRLLTRHALSNRAWGLLLLRLDRAFAQVAGTTLAHQFSPALGALIAAISRFPFLRAACEDGSLFFEAEHLGAVDFAIVLATLAARREDVLADALLAILDADALCAALLPRLDAFGSARRQAIAALRGGFERFQTDPLDDAFELLERTARQFGTLKHGLAELQLAAVAEARRFEGDALIVATEPLAVLLAGLSELLLRSAVSGRDDAAAQRLLRSAAPLLIGADTQDNFWQHPMLARSLLRLCAGVALPDEVQQRIAGLVHALSGLAKDCVDYSIEWLEHAEWRSASAGAARRVLTEALQRVLILHRFHDSASARAQWREETSTRLLLLAEGAQLEDWLLALQRFPQDLAHSGMRLPEVVRSALLRSLSAFEGNRTALKMVRCASTLAEAATRNTLERAPEYAERIGERGRLSCLRDTRFTVQRLAQSLGGSDAAPADAMLWWWTATIGTYLVSRDTATMQIHLQSMHQALGTALDRDELALASEVLDTVYRKALSVSAADRNLQVAHHRDLHDQTLARWGLKADPKLCARHQQALLESCADLGALDASAQAALRCFMDGVLLRGDYNRACADTAALAYRYGARLPVADLVEAWQDARSELRQKQSPMLAAWTQLLWTAGEDALVQAGLARHLQACSAELGTLAHALVAALPEVSTAQQHDAAVRGERDLRLFVRAMADTLAKDSLPLATINIGRYWLECLLPFTRFGARSWLQALVALEALLAAPCAVAERKLLRRICTLLFALAEHSETLSPITERLFAQSDLVLAQSSAEESEWRALAGALVVCAIWSADTRLHAAPGFEHALLASGLAAEELSTDFPSMGPELARFLGADTTLLSGLERTAATGVRLLRALALGQSAPALVPFDLVAYSHPNSGFSRQWWCFDRAARCEAEAVSTPLPIDLLLLRAVEWPGLDMVGVRNASTLCAIAFGTTGTAVRRLCAATGTSAAHESALRTLVESLAVATAFQRPAEPFVGLLAWAQHEAGLFSDGLLAGVRPVLAAWVTELVDRLADDEGFGFRLIEFWQHFDALNDRALVWHGLDELEACPMAVADTHARMLLRLLLAASLPLTPKLAHSQRADAAAAMQLVDRLVLRRTDQQRIHQWLERAVQSAQIPEAQLFVESVS